MPRDGADRIKGACRGGGGVDSQTLTDRLFRFRHIVLLLALLVAGLTAGIAHAQGVGQANGLVADQRKAIEVLAKRVDALDARIDASAEDDAQLVDIRLQLGEIAGEVLKSSVAFRPRLAEINAGIEQIGPPPVEGQPPEPDIVTAERQSLLSEKAEINAVLGLAEALSIRVNALVDRIAAMRSELFRNLLTKRYDLMDAFGSKLAEDVRAEFRSFWRSISSWARFVFQFKFQAVLAATFFALASALVLLVGGRRGFARYLKADPSAMNPSYLSRLTIAFWSVLLPSLAVAVFFGATYFFFKYFNVLRGDIEIFLRTTFLVATVVFCVNRLANALLSPTLPNWRLVPVESRPARLLVRLTTAMALVIGINNLLAVITEEMGSPLSLTIARSFVATVVVGLLLLVVGLLRPSRDPAGEWRPWPTWLRALVFCIGGFTIAAALLGYIGLAIFVAMQVVVTGTILITAYIGFLSSRAIGAEGGFAATSLGGVLAEKWSADEAVLDQCGLIASIAINLMIVLIFLPLILLTWGFRPGDIETWAYALVTGFTVGTFSFSPLGILTGIAVFLIGYFLTRWFQGWLDNSVMARGRVDSGLRNSIRTMVGYAGLAVAALVAISAAGINLASLALIAGGLSLGIGFGLQNVVSNFVSGLILLAERPFKVGDWIVAGDVSGSVRKISVRATEVETFQRQTVILPNSTLINSAVGNWTHRNRIGRIDIKVGVAYGADAKRAHALLLEIARAHPLVLKNPEPFALFANFGPAALEFEIRVFTADVTNGASIQNDVRFAILDTFAAEGIPIPSAPRAPDPVPETDWTHDDEKAEAELMEAGNRKAAAPRTDKRRRRRPDPG